MKTTVKIRIVIGLGLAVLAPLGGVRAQDGLEAAPSSRLSGITLTAARRITDRNAQEQVFTQLDELAKQLGKSCQEPEALVWGGGDYQRATAKSRIDAVVAALKNVGYTVNAHPAGQSEGSDLTIVTAAKPDAAGITVDTLAGIFAVGDEALLLGWCRLGAPVTGKVLVAGRPPLTQSVVDRFNGMLAWFLGVAPNDRVKSTMTTLLTGAWKEGDAATIASVSGLVAADADIQEHLKDSPAKIAFLRRRLEHDILQRAAQADVPALLKALAELHAAAHPKVADGSVSLTTGGRDAFVEMGAFICRALPNGVELTARERAALSDWVSRSYGEFTPEQQQSIASLPVLVAGIRAVWPELPEAQKREVIAGWDAGWSQYKDALLRQRPANAAWDALMPVVKQVQVKQDKGTVKPEDYEALAKLQLKTAEAFRAAGGEENGATAQQLAQYAEQERAKAKELREAKAAGSRPAQTASAGKGLSSARMTDIQERIRSSNSRYTFLSNMMTQMHVARMNSLLTWGDSPYRYEIRRW